MSDPYTNLDLDTAEELLIAAGRPELAAALRYQAQGVRNLVQGEWGQSFIASLEGLLTRHIQPLADGQVGMRAALEATATDIKKEIGDMGAALGATIGRVDTLEETQHDHSEKIAAHAARISVGEERLTAFEVRLGTVEAVQASLKRQIAAVLTHLKRDREFLRALREEHGGGV